ncbi:protein mono-ADP-ribosyltransferase PARP14-like [Ruditapes philippinarum]|uniref:protein mono-ADP-ribosyltransferase PARP14-like n=1 Tax=Ruditapes philippinarum TaxID=129788 RepID=UPI00295BDDBA|nr:protein mono-ADP-ribosyltransferase PARP14-like [Ruditapes philippinarum]
MRKKVPLGRLEINACVLKGDLKLEKSDIIVCAASPDLNLSKGRVARDLMRAAGSQVQQDCNDDYPDGIQHNDIAVVNAGQLPCQQLVFVALQPWGKGNPLQDLETIIEKCLQLACDRGYSSIAFPALGTGLLKYPAVNVAQTTFQCIEDFSNRNTSTSLKFVNIIIYYKDHRTYSCFEREAKSRAPDRRRARLFSVPRTLECDNNSDAPSYWSQRSNSRGSLRVYFGQKNLKNLTFPNIWLTGFKPNLWGRVSEGEKVYENSQSEKRVAQNVEKKKEKKYICIKNYARKKTSVAKGKQKEIKRAPA